MVFLQFIIFCFLFLVCPSANAARHTGTTKLEIISEPYVSNYGTRKIVKELEVSEPYMTNYGGRKMVKEVEISEPYMTNYGARKTVKEVEISEPYMTNYGVKKSLKELVVTEPYMANYGAKKRGQEAEEPYATNYGVKKSVKEAVVTERLEEEDAPYITSYETKEGIQEVEAAYITQYGTKEGEGKDFEAPYITQYGTKGGKVEEVEAPYITGYISAQDNTKEVETPYSTEGRKGTNEVEAPYMTGYISTRGTKSTENVEVPYITQYGDKEASRITHYGTKEDNSKVEQTDVTGYKTKTKEVAAPYITGYISAQGTKATKEVEAPYITGYAQRTKVKKEVEAPYITGYISTQGTKHKKEVEEPYITGYISAKGTKGKKDVEAPYVTGYSSAQGTKGTKEVEAPYITGYISAQGTKNCEHQKHVNPPSQNVDSGKESHMEHQHQDHIHAHSSFPKDHTEALKQGFFTFEDFYKGNSLPLNFPKQEHSRFLPKETADSIPFSTSQLPHLLQLFSIPRDSRDAKHMAWTLDQCELKPIKGETKFCANSLESMTDFVQKIIGSGVNFNILSTTHPETSTAITQKYTILDEPKQVLASKMVFCHPVPYPYAVFFCHHFENDTKFFKVSLGGENGDKVEAVAVCHMDTSDWDPNHNLFHLLGIKAGASSPVCHFFPANHLVWIPSSPAAAAF